MLIQLRVFVLRLAQPAILLTQLLSLVIFATILVKIARMQLHVIAAYHLAIES
jgi:hypothetical protein